jgi:hypothetical protein
MKVFKLELEYVEPLHFTATGIVYLNDELPDSVKKRTISENRKPSK